jgi:hypothetical protein
VGYAGRKAAVNRLPVGHAQKHFHAAFALPGKITMDRGTPDLLQGKHRFTRIQ